VAGQAAQTGKATRDAHPKAHGCVKANFHVNENLPQDLQSNVFVPGKTYKSWIRYSNGKEQNDNAGDGRGMAVKLTGVSGEKIQDDERNTQDFLMINHNVFFIRNNADYVDFFQAAAKGSPMKFFFPGANPANWRLRELNIGRKIQGKTVGSPLETPYWSMVPYLHGSRAMKYMVKPCSSAITYQPNKKNPDYLRNALSETLSTRSACFEFLVQFQGNPTTMPVEDPTVEWDEAVSAPIKVATIEIPAQKFENAKQMEFCENISMNPWHSVVEHRPLGGISRARQTVYNTISKLRHDLNKEARLEPTGNEIFE
jgi:hypothetical protein